jgi:hypothetical protein
VAAKYDAVSYQKFMFWSNVLGRQPETSEKKRAFMTRIFKNYPSINRRTTAFLRLSWQSKLRKEICESAILFVSRYSLERRVTEFDE